MSKDQILSLVRSVILGVASFLVGKNVFGHPLDDITLFSWVSTVLGLGAAIWGFFDKSTTIEAWQSALRSVGVTIGGILIGLGKTSQGTVDTYLGLLTALAPIIYGILSRQKTVAIETGKVDIKTLAGGTQSPANKP